MEQRGPAACSVSDHKEGKDEMTKASMDLQDLRRRIYVKAKAETSWRFWGLYVHVCKLDTLREAYALAKKNDGAPGSDGVTFEAIEAQGVEAFLEQIADELVGRSYAPLPARRQEIPKDGGKVRVLSIPAIRDRVAQGALKLILEPIFEADFQPGSFGYRPQRTAHEAVDRVARAIGQHKTRVIDIDLRSYFDNVRHDRLLAKVAQRVDDADVMHLLKVMLKASGKQGVPQGGVISPLLSNIYLTEVDRMLERAKEATRYGKYTSVEYARFADDLGARNWPSCRSKSTKKRVESWTSAEARASAFWGSTSAACVVCGAHGAPTTRPSSKSGRRCYASSRMCSAATHRNRLIGS